MATLPPISVIIPTWNRRGVISRALDSVLAQTHGDLEILVIDDGSTDGTEEFIKSSYPSTEMPTGKRLCYHRLPHCGVSAARNFGLEAARAELIAYLDTDNHWHPEYATRMAELFGRHENILSAYAAIHFEDSINNSCYILFRDYNRDHLLYQNFIDINIFMHRKDAYLQHGGFDIAMTRLVDWEMIIRYTENSPPLALQEVLATYHFQPDLAHITRCRGLRENLEHVLRKHARELFASPIPHRLNETSVPLWSGTLAQPEWHSCYAAIVEQLIQDGAQAGLTNAQ